MKRLAALAAALLIAGAAQAAPPAFPLGEIRPLSLDAAGQTVVTVKPKGLAVLEADIFAAPDAAGDIVLEVLGKDGQPLPPGSPAGPGPVQVRIKAASPGATRIQLRVRADPSVDGFEPNDARGKARKAALPFAGWIEIGPGDQDWFRVEAPAGGVVGVSLSPTPAGRLRFLDARGAVIQETAANGSIGGGITYVATRGGRLYVVVEGPESGGRQVSRLTISRYAAPRGADGALVTVGVGEDSETREQLNLAARAAGAKAIDAQDADAIGGALTEALATTPAAAKRPPWLMALIAALALAAAGGGFLLWRRTRGTAPARDPAPKAEPDPKPADPAL
jgi:hypothetical protein